MSTFAIITLLFILALIISIFLLALSIKAQNEIASNLINMSNLDLTYNDRLRDRHTSKIAEAMTITPRSK